MQQFHVFFDKLSKWINETLSNQAFKGIKVDADPIMIVENKDGVKYAVTTIRFIKTGVIPRGEVDEKAIHKIQK